MEDGSRLIDFGDIKAMAHNFYKDLITRQDVADDHNIEALIEHIFAIVTEAEKWILTHPIEETEVFTAIWGLELDKAPSPDEFPISFTDIFGT